MVKQVEELKNTVENFNLRFGDQHWRKEQLPIESTTMYCSRSYNRSDQARFENPCRNQYHPPLVEIQNRNPYQYWRENPLERSQIGNYHHYWQMAPQDQYWRGKNTQNTQYPQSPIRHLADYSRSSPPNQATFADTHRCNKCGRFGHSAYSCFHNTVHKEANMMRHNSQNSRPEKYRRRNRHRNRNTSVSSEGKGREFLRKLAPCSNSHEQNSRHNLVQVDDTIPSVGQSNSSPTLRLSPDAIELAPETSCEDADPNEPDKENSDAFEQPHPDDAFEFQPVREDSSNLSQVNPLGGDDSYFDGVQSIASTSHQFEYNLSCRNALGSNKYWFIGSTQDLGFDQLGVCQIVMSPRESLLPFSQLEAKAWCAALKHWEPWFRTVNATVTCVTPTDENTSGLINNICNEVEGITIMNVQPDKFSLKFSSNDEAHYPFDPGILM